MHIEPDIHKAKPVPRDYADKDISLLAIAKFSAGITIFTVLTFWGAKVLLLKMEKNTAALDNPASQFGLDRVVPPLPHLLVNEKHTLDEQRAIDHQALTTYGWIDQNAGVVRIPVENAMDIIAERGLPARAAR